MDKVLVVDDNLDFLDSLKDGLKNYKEQFELLFASGVNEAVQVLKREAISLLVTDLKMPKVDGLALLAYMSNNFFQIPCIVMTGYGSPAIRKRLDEENIFHYIEKPFSFTELAEAIIEGLDLRDEFASLKDISGVSVFSFVQLIEMEKKTCLLEACSNSDGKGLFYFEDGVLYDAICDSLKAEPAAIKMLSWDKARFKFKKLPKKKIVRQINTDLVDLISRTIKYDGKMMDDDKGFTPPEFYGIEEIISREIKASKKK